jgi:Chromosome segregation ATPases
LIKTTRFQDILELDSGYYTPQNIGNSDKSNSFMETFLSEKNQKQQDLSLVNNNEEALKEEIQRLNKNIQEKDEEIKNLQILNEKFENRVKSLEVALLRTKELIFSKEKECAEYHTLKKTKQNDSKILNNSLSMLPNGPQLLFNPTPEKPNEVIADNDYIIKHASCDSSSVLYENNQISINFEGNLENESYKMILNIKNKSDFLIQNFDLDIDSAFGFNFDVNPYNNEINPGDSVFVVINITLICYTHLTPTVFINFYVESQQYKLLLKIPINYCKFAKGIHSNFNDLWNEWEFLVFDNESFRFRQEFSLDLYKKLIKLSQNAIVLCKEN